MPDSNGLIFGALSTTDEVLAGVDLSGKRVLVTGVSAGLGVETARALAARGAHVIGAARDLRKAESAMEQAWESAKNGGGVELIALDLASLASVRACADKLVAAGKPLDLVINNAGVMACPFSRTADGFEMQFGTNHLGHFVLTNRIASLLRSGSRVVALSSSGHRFADVDLDDPNFERTAYDPWIAYGRSKTADALFAVAFDRRHRERGVRAAAVHPGGIDTELARHLDSDQLKALIDKLSADLIAKGATAVPIQDRAAGCRDLGLGGSHCVGRGDRRTLLRELPGNDAGDRRRHRHDVSRRAPLRHRSRAGRGALGQERGTGRRKLHVRRR